MTVPQLALQLEVSRLEAASRLEAVRRLEARRLEAQQLEVPQQVFQLEALQLEQLPLFLLPLSQQQLQVLQHQRTVQVHLAHKLFWLSKAFTILQSYSPVDGTDEQPSMDISLLGIVQFKLATWLPSTHCHKLESF